MPVSTVNPLPEPPNTTTDTKPVFLAKANTFNGELKKTIDGFNANVPELNAVGTAVNTVIPHLTQIDRVAQSAADVDVVAPKITDVETVSANITGVVSTANNMSAVLAAPSYAQRAETAAGQAEAIAGAGIATTSKAGLVKPRNGLAVDALGNLDVERAVFALGYPVVTMTPKVATGCSTNVSLSAPAVLLPGATVTAYHVSVDGGPVQDVSATDNAAVFTFTPGGAAGTTVTLRVTATDSVGNVSLETTATAEVVNGYVVAPTMVAPVAASTILAIDVTMSTSTFAAFGIDETQTAAQFLIKDTSGAVVYDSGEVTDMTTHVVMAPPVTRGQSYTVCARHKGAQLGWSGYGPATSVTFSTDRTGERIDGKATIIGKLGSNWIAWLDAAYRGKDLKWGKYGTDLSGLPNFAGSYTVAEGWTAEQILAQSCKDTQTSKQNTDYLKTQNSGTDGQNITGVPAAAHCFGISISGTTAQLPNVQTGAFGFANKGFIDRFDPTAAANPTKAMSQIGNYWTSSEHSSTSAYFVSSGGTVGYTGKEAAYSVCPVLEIAA
jgi:hypothetical protein